MDINTIYQNPRFKRPERRPTSYQSAIIIIILIAVCIGSIAYCTAKARKDNGSLSGFDSSELTVVVTPELTDAQLLHYPGFDVMYSNMHRQPYYVAWALTPEHAGATDVERSNNFRPDENVQNPAELSDYRRSGFDRGHMAPAGDFKYDIVAQEATFLLSNISPQHHDLNTRAWKNVEEQCRKWALRDSTIYIISGPVLNDYLTETIGKNKVTVPARFFKVVLAPYANPPRAIGFLMPNRKVDGGVQSTVMSVDQIEQITGYDFFSALPDEIENEIEAAAAYHVWQTKQRK